VLAIALAALSLLPADAPAGDDLRVLDESSRPSKMLSTFLLDEAHRLFDARRAVVAALKTPEDVRRRQESLRGKFLESLGAFPEKTPLNAQVVGREAREGYTVERVVFESRPGHHITANLYLPDGAPPFPGVLVPCGHKKEGKAGETYQRASILLAKNGLAALCYDPIGQGERVQILDDQGKPALPESTAEHNAAGVGALLVGRQAAHYRIWDGIRALDYLASRPEIDATRLGCTGNSGGGTMTAYLMPLDDRIAAAAPSCYITSLERLLATIGPQDAEQIITGQVAFGMDHADYLTLRAPKPTLVCVGTRDYFDIDGAWASFREAKLVYGRLGFGERIDLFEFDDPHGFSRPRREAAMRWMRRWLLHRDDAPTESDFPIADEARLRVTTSGQVLREYPGERSVFDLNADRADALAKARPRHSLEELRSEVRKRLALPLSPDQLRPEVFKRLTLPPPDIAPWAESVGSVQREGYAIERLAIHTDRGTTIPVLLARSGDAVRRKPVVVYVGADRRLAAPGGPIEERVRAGEIVALVEPRGTGETAPDVARPGRFGVDEKEAFLSLLLSRPLLGQRVHDVLQTLKYLDLLISLRPADGGEGFHVIASGNAGPIALHAAVLDDRIKTLEIGRSIVSWSAVVRSPLARDQLSAAVPGALESYDLPDLAAALAPRPLTIRGPVDPEGKPAARGDVEAAFAPALASYRARDAAGRLMLEP
jgi:dienelactone hydrolase